MPITGTIPILQPIAPFNAVDINPTHISRYGLGGIHSVGTTAERDAISMFRREVGMLAYVSSLDKYYSLVGSTSNTGWQEFTVDAVGDGVPAGPEGAVQFKDGTAFSGSSDLIFDSDSQTLVLGTDAALEFGDGTVQRTARNFYGVTAATSSAFPAGLSGTGNTGDRLLIATGPSSDPFRNYVKFGNAWFQTGVVGIGQGTQGIQGTAGERGPTGATGERGATGSFTGNYVSTFNAMTGDVAIFPGKNIDLDFISFPPIRGFVINTTPYFEFGDGTTQGTARNFYGITGSTAPSFPLGMSGAGNTGDRLLIATGASSDPFRNYVRFGNAWFQTGVVGIGQGPKGDQGNTGATGERGATGSFTGNYVSTFNGYTGNVSVLPGRNIDINYISLPNFNVFLVGTKSYFEFGDGTTQGTARNFYGITGPTAPIFPLGMSGAGNTGDRLLIATGSSADPFRNYVRFGNAWFQTGVVGIGQGPQGIQGTAGATGATGATGVRGHTGTGAGMPYRWLSDTDYTSLQDCDPPSVCCSFENGKIAIFSTNNGGTTPPIGGFPTFPFLSISGKDLVGNNEQGYIEWWHNIPELTDRDVIGGVIDIRADDESSFTGHIAWEIRGRWSIGEAQLFCPGERTYFFGGRLLSGLTGSDMFPEGTKLRINFSKAGIQGTTGEKGATGNPAVFIDSFSTTIPEVVVKGSASHSLLGESISLTYAGRIAPITGGIYLTDPTKGTGFPVYFPTAAFDTVTFGNQTITAGIGETVTLRIVVTGNGGGFDVHDYPITIGNEVRWGKSSLTSLTAGDIQAFLSNTLAKNDLENEFHITMTNGEYIYWCHPTRLGRSYQSINNGAYGGMSLQGERDLTGSPTVAYTNVNGYEESFYVYRSENTFRVSNLPVRTASAQ